MVDESFRVWLIEVRLGTILAMACFRAVGRIVAKVEWKHSCRRYICLGCRVVVR